MGTLEIQFEQLNNDQLNKLKGYLSAQGNNLDSIIETYLIHLFKVIESKLSNVGKCPNCFVSEKENNDLKGLPISEAEFLGFVKIGNDDIRKFFKQSDTYFVLCTHCGWWGWPDKSNLDSWKELS